jgi:hypothetical protein
VLLIKTSAFCWNNNCVIINMHGKTTIKIVLLVKNIKFWKEEGYVTEQWRGNVRVTKIPSLALNRDHYDVSFWSSVTSLGTYDVIIVRVLFYWLSLYRYLRQFCFGLRYSFCNWNNKFVCLFTVVLSFAPVRCCVVGRVIVSNPFDGTCWVETGAYCSRLSQRCLRWTRRQVQSTLWIFLKSSVDFCKNIYLLQTVWGSLVLKTILQ